MINLAKCSVLALAVGIATPALAEQDVVQDEVQEEAAPEQAVEPPVAVAEEAPAETVDEVASIAAEETTVAQADEAPAVPVSHTPEGSPHFIPAPPAGKGQIVFFRSSAMGFAIGCTVNQGTKDNKIKVSSLGSGKYVIVTADPGKQEYWVQSEAKDVLNLLVEEGETQFVECRIKMGFFVGRPDLSPSSPQEFVEKGAKLKLVDDEDMGEGALRAADIEALGAGTSHAEATDAEASS